MIRAPYTIPADAASFAASGGSLTHLWRVLVRSQIARSVNPLDTAPGVRPLSLRSKSRTSSELLWARRPSAATKVQGGLCEEQIVAAALDIIDGEGIEALNMRRIASDLGVGTMSLYWHVRNKEDLLWLVVDDIVGTVELPPATGTWRGDLLALLRNFRAALLFHRRALPLLNGRPGFGPKSLPFVDRMLGALRLAGFSPPAAARAYGICVVFALGFTMTEVVTVDQTWDGSPRAEALKRDLAAYLADLPGDEHPNLRSMSADLIWSGGDAAFELGLRALVDGFDVLLSSAEALA
jgi:AcrR family transcriptional regulator